jgi:KaiC/GvpD/RAD55 family RecA-like ATPase
VTRPHEGYDEVPPDFDRRHLLVEAQNQTLAAEIALARPADDFLRWPWHALDTLYGPIPPSELLFVCAFSGSGKTTLLMSLLDEWYDAGKTITYLGLESAPWKLRMQWACRRLARTVPGFDLHPADAVKGVLQARVEGGDARAAWMLDLIRADFDAQRDPKGERYQRVRFVPTEELNVRALQRAVTEAVQIQSDVVIVDHIDHIDGDAANAFEESKQVTRACHRFAQQSEIPFVVATQANSEALKGDPLGSYRPPQPNHVWMGQLKRQRADGMLGLSRKLISPPTLSGDRERDKLAKEKYRESMEHARQGGEALTSVLVPNVMQVVLMKDRAYGKERALADLYVEHGRVTDLPDADARRAEADVHGIHTAGARPLGAPALTLMRGAA